MSAALTNEVGVRFFAETGELKTGSEGAANDVERSAERMRQSIVGLKDAMQGHMSTISNHVKAANDSVDRSFDNIAESSRRTGAMIGAAFVALGGAVVVAAKGAIDSLDKMNEEAERLGMTTEALSKLTYAAKLAGVEQNELTSAVARFSAKMQDAMSGDKNAVAWFKDIGVSVKDASGKMKSADKMLEEVADRFAQFEDGAAKTALAIDGFGRSGARLIPLLNQGSEGMREMYREAEQLGAAVGDKAAAEAAKFNDQLDRLSTLTSGAAKSMVSDLLPALNAVLERFVTGARVVGGFAGGISMLLDGGGKPGEKINALTVELNDLLAARDRYLKSNADTSSIDTAIAHIQKKIKAYKELQIARVLAESGGEYGNEGRGLTQGGGKAEISRTTVEKDKKDKKPQAEQSQMPLFEANLLAIKSEYMRLEDLRQMSLEQEKQYWDDLLNMSGLSEKERFSIMKKGRELELQILKKSAADGNGLAQEAIEEWKRTASSGIDIQAQAADLAYSLGEITSEQRLELERGFEQQRYEIAALAIQERVALMKKDPNMSPVEYQKLKNQLLEIDRKHALDKRSIDGKIDVAQAMPAKNMFAAMENSFSGALTGMLTRAQTWRQALNGIYQSLTQTFIRDIVVKQGVDYAAGLLKQTALYRTFFATKQSLDTAGAAVHSGTETAKTAATLAGVTTRAAAETAASGQSVMMRLGSAISSIMISAWEAMAGAFAAMASIPYVGPFLAVGAGAAAFAAVAGIVGSLPSAAGGYDIPAGVNPVTQLHEEEMVLPREHANTIRRMSGDDGGSSGGGTTQNHFHISAMDAKSFSNYVKKNASALAPALHEMVRKNVKV